MVAMDMKTAGLIQGMFMKGYWYKLLVGWQWRKSQKSAALCFKEEAHVKHTEMLKVKLWKYIDQASTKLASKYLITSTNG